MVNENFFVITIATVVILFMAGIFYLSLNDRKNNQEMFEKCIAAGNQYVSGNCVVGRGKN